MTNKTPGQNVVQGNVEKIVTIGKVVGNVIVADKDSIDNLKFPSKKIGPRKDGFRAQYLEQCKKFWIDNLLSKSLERGDVGVSAGPAPEHLYFFANSTAASRKLPPKGLLELFDSNNGDILVLGTPGSGKTTLMLQLVRILLKRASVDETQKMPLVINLTEWSSFTTTISADVDVNPSADTLARLKDGDRFRLTLGRFIYKVLTEQYKIPVEIVKTWIDNNVIAIFLDGFDEVLESVRPMCTKELNIYRKAYPEIPMVVCSRTAEYEQLVEKLHMETVLVVSELSSGQVQKYLKQLGLTHLVKLIKNEPATAELCCSPFWLGLMVQAYAHRSWESFGIPKDMKARSYDLLESYLAVKSGYSLTDASRNERNRARKLAALMAVNGVSMLSFESLKETHGWGSLNKAFEMANTGFSQSPTARAAVVQAARSIQTGDPRLLAIVAVIGTVEWIFRTGSAFVENRREKKRLEEEYQQYLQAKQTAQKEYEEEMKSFGEIAEHMVACGLMRKVGENYIWVHEIIKRYMAET